MTSDVCHQSRIHVKVFDFYLSVVADVSAVVVMSLLPDVWFILWLQSYLWMYEPCDIAALPYVVRLLCQLWTGLCTKVEPSEACSCHWDNFQILTNYNYAWNTWLYDVTCWLFTLWLLMQCTDLMPVTFSNFTVWTSLGSIDFSLWVKDLLR